MSAPKKKDNRGRRFRQITALEVSGVVVFVLAHSYSIKLASIMRRIKGFHYHAEAKDGLSYQHGRDKLTARWLGGWYELPATFENARALFKLGLEYDYVIMPPALALAEKLMSARRSVSV